MNTKKLLMLFIAGGLILVTAACADSGRQVTPEPPVGLSNPASVFCIEQGQGHTLEMRPSADGTAGYCVFPDGTACEEWAFFREECSRSTSWSVQQIDMLILESFPVQIVAQVRGTLSNSCVEIESFEEQFNADQQTFYAEPLVITVGEGDCPAAPAAFEESVALNVVGLAAGEYTLFIGGQQASFKLEMDNVFPED